MHFFVTFSVSFLQQHKEASNSQNYPKHMTCVRIFATAAQKCWYPVFFPKLFLYTTSVAVLQPCFKFLAQHDS